MYRKICVTNRHLAEHPFLEQLERVLATKPYAMILREKDLEEKPLEPAVREEMLNKYMQENNRKDIPSDYELLAALAIKMCKNTDTKLILHHYPDIAVRLEHPAIHMPLHLFTEMPEEQKRLFSVRGVSVHSVEDALLAEQSGATYLTAGHVFVTDCKKGLAPRGLNFLREVCSAVQIPVYAIGGINDKNMADCIRAGAAGVCMMSEYMKI